MVVRALGARRRVCTDSMMLNAIGPLRTATLGPVVTSDRNLTVAKLGSMGLVVRR